MSRPGILSSVLTLLLGTAVFGNGAAVGSDMAVTSQAPGFAATSQTGARPPDTNPYMGTTPSGPPPSPYGSGLVMEPPPLPSVPATSSLDRADAAATAAAVLTAYRNRDLEGLAALSTPENSSMIGDIAAKFINKSGEDIQQQLEDGKSPGEILDDAEQTMIGIDHKFTGRITQNAQTGLLEIGIRSFQALDLEKEINSLVKELKTQ